MKRTLLYNWLIDGSPMLSPDEGIQMQKSNVECSDSAEDESGFYHPILLRTDVHVWSFTYSVLDAEEYSYMDGILRGKGSFTFSYPDSDGRVKSCTARCRQTSVSWMNARTGQRRNYRFDILEC